MTNPPADLVLIGGPVIAMVPGAQPADGLAIRHGRIAAVGTAAAMRRWIGPETEILELASRAVLPGLIDCHTHVATDAKEGTSVELRDFHIEMGSVTDLLGRLHAAARAAGPNEWVVGRGSPMQDARLAERRLPTRTELDAAGVGHPVYVTFGSHVLIANSAALERFGITRDTESPRRGLVVKDPLNGEPTGEFRDGAGALFRFEQLALGVRLADQVEIELRRCLARGVTTIHDVIAASDEVSAYQELRAGGRLPLRVHLLVRVFNSDFSPAGIRELGLRQGFGDDRLKLGGVKCSVDGGFTGRTAAFSQPLGKDGLDRGLLRMTQAELDDLVIAHHRVGVRVCVHAIGDIALDMALLSFETAVAGRVRPDLRHRVEHMGNWLCTPERLARAKAAGVSAVANPAMLHYLADEIVAALGVERSMDAFPFHAIMAAGLPLGFGSDGPGLWPSDPLRDVCVAVTRRGRDGFLLAPALAISPLEALRACTTTAAWLGYDENLSGSIAVGRPADLVVVDRSPLAVMPEEIGGLAVDCTIVGGTIAYSRPR